MSFTCKGANNRGLWNEKGVAFAAHSASVVEHVMVPNDRLVLHCFYLSGVFTTFEFKASSGVRPRSAR